MDVLTRHTKDDTSWYIVFADAIVLVDEIKVKNYGGVHWNPSVLS